MSNTMSLRRFQAAVVALVLVLGAAACSDDEGGASAAGDGGGERSGPPAAVEGCDEGGTDLDVHDGSLGLARCETGMPAPAPLDEVADVVIGLPSLQLELFNPLVVADTLGEFEKENLDVSFETVSPSDYYTLLADGTVDVTFAPAAAMFNAIDSGFETRWTLGLTRNEDRPQSGYWAKSDVSVDDLAGRTVGSSTGTGSATILPLYDAIQEAGGDISEVEFTQVPSADAVTALRNDAVDVAVVTDPFWQELADDPDFTFLAPSGTIGESSNGLAFGPELLGDRDVATAFVRAYVRTLSTYFVDDYKQDAELMDTISEATEVPVEQLTASPAILFDYEIRNGVATRMQEAFAATDALSYSDPLDEDDIVDRSFVEDALGVDYSA